jgi:hypothetical protein
MASNTALLGAKMEMFLLLAKNPSRRLKNSGHVAFKRPVYVDRFGEADKADATVPEMCDTSLELECGVPGSEATLVDALPLISLPNMSTKSSSTEVILNSAPFPTTVLDAETSLAPLLIVMLSPLELNERGKPSMLLIDLPEVRTSSVVNKPSAI